MRFTSLISLATLPLVVRAAPLLQSRQGPDTNTLVLRQSSTTVLVPPKNTLSFYSPFHLEFAEVLNQFESQFYAKALEKFQDSDFAAAGFSVTDVPKEIFKYAR